MMKKWGRRLEIFELRRILWIENEDEERENEINGLKLEIGLIKGDDENRYWDEEEYIEIGKNLKWIGGREEKEDKVEKGEGKDIIGEDKK